MASVKLSPGEDIMIDAYEGIIFVKWDYEHSKAYISIHAKGDNKVTQLSMDDGAWNTEFEVKKRFD